MYRRPDHAGSFLLATFAAGPLFLITMALAAAYLQLPHPIPFDGTVLLIALPALAFSLIPGMVVGLLLNGLGTIVMTALADHFTWARSAMAWTFAGAVAGFGMARAFGSSPEVEPLQFALVATSAICAWLCHGRLNWHDEEE